MIARAYVTLIESSLPFLQEGIFAQKFLGSSLGSYILFLFSIIVFFIIGKLFMFVFKRYVRSLAVKTRNKFDDIVVEVLSTPLIWLFILIGIYFGLRFLSIESSALASVDFIISSVAILFIAWIFWRLVDSIIKFYLMPLARKTATQLDDQLISFSRNVAKAAIVIITLSMILSKLGYDITALVTSLGIGSLAFAFAAKETITDIFGGVSILTSQPFVIGDKVKIGSSIGIVHEIGLTHTRLLTEENYLITIPNRKVANSEVVNMSIQAKKLKKK